MVAGRSERDRMVETKEKTGVLTGAHALNLFAFEIWMGMGLLFVGPIIVIFARRKRSRGPHSD